MVTIETDQHKQYETKTNTGVSFKSWCFYNDYKKQHFIELGIIKKQSV